jgi:hypothetical protein
VEARVVKSERLYLTDFVVREYCYLSGLPSIQIALVTYKAPPFDLLAICTKIREVTGASVVQ